MSSKKLYRSEDDRVIAGVCGGIAEVYDYDPSLVRIAVLLAVLFTSGAGLIAYIAAALVVPSKSEI